MRVDPKLAVWFWTGFGVCSVIAGVASLFYELTPLGMILGGLIVPLIWWVYSRETKEVKK